MSETSNTLKLAIRNAINGALQMQKAAPCEVCGKEPAMPYAFAYAKVINAVSSQYGTTTTTVATYGPIEGRVVHLCDTCLATYKKPILRKTRTQIIVSVLALLLLIILSLFLAEWREILLFAAIIPGMVFLISVYQVRQLSTNTQSTGSMKALSLHEEELKRQGYDGFWAKVPD